MFDSSVIVDNVLAEIRRAKVVIADLTGRNPDVFYEVGIAHALGTPVLLITQSIDNLPFDLRNHRVLVYDYSPHGCRVLERQLEEHLKQMLKAVATPNSRL